MEKLEKSAQALGWFKVKKEPSECDGCLERKENLTVDEKCKSVNLVFQHKSDSHKSRLSTCVTIVGPRARKIPGARQFH